MTFEVSFNPNHSVTLIFESGACQALEEASQNSCAVHSLEGLQNHTGETWLESDTGISQSAVKQAPGSLLTALILRHRMQGQQEVAEEQQHPLLQIQSAPLEDGCLVPAFMGLYKQQKTQLGFFYAWKTLLL